MRYTRKQCIPYLLCLLFLYLLLACLPAKTYAYTINTMPKRTENIIRICISSVRWFVGLLVRSTIRFFPSAFSTKYKRLCAQRQYSLFRVCLFGLYGIRFVSFHLHYFISTFLFVTFSCSVVQYPSHIHWYNAILRSCIQQSKCSFRFLNSFQTTYTELK